MRGGSGQFSVITFNKGLKRGSLCRSCSREAFYAVQWEAQARCLSRERALVP